MTKELNARQNAKLNMYRTTAQHIDDNASIGISPAFQTAFNKFKATNTAIQTVAQQKSATLVGATADKSNAKQTLCQTAANLAGIVFAYASANNNETLKQEMNLPVTTLLRTRDEALVPRCQMIHAKAAANLAALFKENDDILKNQMDKLIELYRADHPDFVNTYFEARIIVDPPTIAKKPKDTVSNMDSKDTKGERQNG